KVEYSFRTYLFAAARHRIVDHIRRNLVREEYAEHLRRLSPAFRSLEEELNARELEANVTNQLTQLPETTRRIYLLSREEGKSIKEIAETLHLSEQTVKNNISKALKHLRNTLHAFFF